MAGDERRGAAGARRLHASLVEARVDLLRPLHADGHFDLVSAQFMHLPPAPRQALFARLAAAGAGPAAILAAYTAGTLGECICATSEMPEAWKRGLKSARTRS